MNKGFFETIFAKDFRSIEREKYNAQQTHWINKKNDLGYTHKETFSMYFNVFIVTPILLILLLSILIWALFNFWKINFPNSSLFSN